MKEWMNRGLALLLAALFCAAPLCARADSQKTAQEMFAENPSPNVPLTRDPYIEPLLRLVNKENPLPWDYVPKLTAPDIPLKPGLSAQQTTEEAAQALESMFSAAKEAGYDLAAVSGYRSYASQKLIYNRKVEERGAASASLSSAPPGKSEHQLGMAMDISCASISYRLNKIFGDTDEGKWLYAHCAEYGFILRYKSEWTKITGYKGEPWHFRYVGEAHARLIMALDVPFETYLEYLELCWRSMNTDIPE